MNIEEATPTLSKKTFLRIADFLFQQTGIRLKEHKMYLVKHRLAPFVGKNKPYQSFEAFFTAVRKDPRLRSEMINALTTNYTFFFREPVHFDFLAEYLRSASKSREPMRLWSAACSTGEEVYSMAITALRSLSNLRERDFKILATDISTRVLKQAQRGIFHYHKVRGHLEDKELRLFFKFNRESKDFLVKPEVKSLIAFRYLNLLENFPFHRKFDLVFLRNVLIYFEDPERELVVNKIARFLKPGGYLILGLSESLVGFSHPYRSLKHSIYQKKN